ncbi:RNA-binding S4 domain-containing protein [candidate division KSB1 bacterium]|nr:RNA-binding S4 domain-containing protein [candidate division KSB1 bacterium]
MNQSHAGELQHQRLDKWLKIARIYKTRALATRACEERRVKVNGHIAKPAKEIKIGDILTIRTSGGKYIDLQILGLSLRSVAARDARTLYEVREKEMSEEEKELLRLFDQAAKKIRPKYKGRPTKRDRRRLEKLKRHFTTTDDPLRDI